MELALRLWTAEVPRETERWESRPAGRRHLWAQLGSWLVVPHWAQLVSPLGDHRLVQLVFRQGDHLPVQPVSRLGDLLQPELPPLAGHLVHTPAAWVCLPVVVPLLPAPADSSPAPVASSAARAPAPYALPHQPGPAARDAPAACLDALPAALARNTGSAHGRRCYWSPSEAPKWGTQTGPDFPRRSRPYHRGQGHGCGSTPKILRRSHVQFWARSARPPRRPWARIANRCPRAQPVVP